MTTENPSSVVGPVVWHLSAYLSRMWREQDQDCPTFRSSVRRIIRGYAKALALDATDKRCVLVACDGTELEVVGVDDTIETA